MAALLAIIGMSLAFVSVHVASYTRLSPVDELSHLDYMFRSPTLLAPGDKVEQHAMYEQACRGVDAPGFDPVLCDRNHAYNADLYQEKGYNTAANFTPIYYASTRGVAEVIRLLTPTDSLFVAARLASGVWLALGLALTFLAGRRMGARPAPLLAVLALLIASPAILYPGATVTPDAMGLGAGAAVLLAALAWEARPERRRLALLVLICVVVALIKLTNIIVVAAIAFYLIFNRSRQPESASDAPETEESATGVPGLTPARRWVAAVVTGAAALVASGAWTVFSSSRNYADPNDVPDMTTRFAVAEFPWAGMLDSSLAMVTPLSSPWVGVGTASLLFFSTMVVSLVLIAGTAAAAMFSVHTPRTTVLARSLLVAAVLVSLGLITMNYVTADQYFALPARYGQALVAPMAVVAASMMRTRGSVLVCTGLAVVALVMSAARVIGLP